MRHPPRKVRDFLLYSLIAIAVVVFAVIFALHQAKTGGSPDLPLKWMGFAGMSAVIFGYGARNNRANWTNHRFWRLFVLFAIVHCSLGFLILLRTPVVPLLFFAIATGIEYFVLSLYLTYFLNW